jgi:predicted GIY-YIG superfamily endonuclease
MEGKNLEDRIKQHNENYYEKSFSSCVSDWELFMKISYGSRSIARKIEKHIK